MSLCQVSLCVSVCIGKALQSCKKKTKKKPLPEINPVGA